MEPAAPAPPPRPAAGPARAVAGRGIGPAGHGGSAEPAAIASSPLLSIHATRGFASRSARPTPLRWPITRCNRNSAGGCRRQIRGMRPGRFPMFLLLVAGGAYRWPMGRFRFILPLVIGFFYLETESSTVLGWMTSLYTAHAEWPTARARLAFLQPAVFGTPTLVAAIAAVVVLSALAIRNISHSIISNFHPDPADQPSARGTASPRASIRKTATSSSGVEL